MRASSAAAAAAAATQFPQLSPLPTRLFSFKTRTQICFSQGLLFFFSVKSAESRVVDNRLHNFRVVPSATLTAKKKATVVPEVAFTVEKEAVECVLTLFLRKQGLTNSAATRTISKSDRFINHLVSRLHTIDKTRYRYRYRYLAGRELFILVLEIRDALAPYLESLLEEHGDILVDVLENFPGSLDNKGTMLQASPTKLPLDSKKLQVMGPVSELLHHGGKLPPQTLYLLDIGMDLDQIKEIHRKRPAFASYSLEDRIKPVVEFLLDIGMSQSDIPSYICNAPFCCGGNLSDTTIPTLLYLEKLGVDKGDWLKILKKSPSIFRCKIQKAKRTVDFLHEIGLSTKNIAEVITKHPLVISHSVDNKLRPIAEHFLAMGVNIPLLLCRFPKVFDLNLEQNIKSRTNFLLEKGFTIDDIRAMVVKFGTFYCLRLKENLIPKWDFFLTMDYPRSELVKFPRYFIYNLEWRIKPRYELMVESGVRLVLSSLLDPDDTKFEKRLKSKNGEKALIDTLSRRRSSRTPPAPSSGHWKFTKYCTTVSSR